VNLLSMTTSAGGRSTGRAVAALTWAVAVAGAITLTGPADAQIRVVNYNIAQLNGNHAALTDVLAELHEDDTSGFAAPVSVFVFQEVKQGDLNQLSNIVNAGAPSGVTYLIATFTSFGEDDFAGAQACFYDMSMLSEVPAEHEDIFTGAGRYADRWKFTLDGYTDPEVSFYIYSAHLKADTGSDDQQQREDGVMDMRADAASLPVGSHFIFAGDFNIYHNGEPAYTLLLAPGTAQVIDPLGSGSWAGPANAFKHTQSPRATGGGGLIGGGLDDRFDFQLPNNEFNDGEGLARIPGTYRSFGNDGNHFDGSINSGNNFYFPGDVTRSNALADDLFNASDHIPVVMDYQVPAVLAVNMATSFGRVIQNADFDVPVNVLHFADAAAPDGADLLHYTITGTDAATGMASGSIEASFTPTVEPLPLDTSSIGPVTAGAVGTTTSEGAQILFNAASSTGRIVRHANGSFDGASDVDADTVNASFDADTGVQLINVNVHNFGFDDDQALLDVDAVTGATGPFTYTGGAITDIDSDPASLPFEFDTTGLPENTFTAELDILTSDEDIPGEATATLSLTLSVTIGDVSQCAADIDGSADGLVNVFDLLELLANWGADGAGSDLADPDDVVNVFDLLELLAAWGVCP